MWSELRHICHPRDLFRGADAFDEERWNIVASRDYRLCNKSPLFTTQRSSADLSPVPEENEETLSCYNSLFAQSVIMEGKGNWRLIPNVCAHLLDPGNLCALSAATLTTTTTTTMPIMPREIERPAPTSCDVEVLYIQDCSTH